MKNYFLVRRLRFSAPPNVRIQTNFKIGAGAIVTKDLPAGKVAVAPTATVR